MGQNSVPWADPFDLRVGYDFFSFSVAQRAFKVFGRLFRVFYRFLFLYKSNRRAEFVSFIFKANFASTE